MTSCLLMLAGLASAAPEPVELDDGAFSVATDAGRLDISRLLLPDAAAKEADQRICRVRFESAVNGPVAGTVGPCAEALVEPTVQALPGWLVLASGLSGEEGEQAVEMEVWIRFGLDEREVPELFVRGDWRHEPTLPVGVGPLPVHQVELPRPDFPEDALAEGSLGAECSVDVELSHRGYLLSEAQVRGCGSPFAEAVLASTKRWRFKPPRIGREPSAVGSTIGVVFETTPGPEPGTLEGQVRTVVSSADTKTFVRSNRPQRSDGIPANAVPLLVLDHDPYAAVQIIGWSWPELDVDEELRCGLLVQVDAKRRTAVWPEDCDPALEAPLVAAVGRWSLRPGEVEPGERYGRFRATAVYGPGAEPYLLVPEADLVAKSEEVGEGRIHTFREPVTKSRVPPKVPKGLDRAEECVLSVEVAPNGKPSQIEAVQCTDSVLAAATKAVKQWRWEPARQDGKPLAWSTTVKVTFAGRG